MVKTMTLREKIEPIGKAYAAEGLQAYHYWRPVQAAPYLIWAEDGDNGDYGENQMMNQAITGTSDYFTKKEYDPAVDKIQEIHNSLGMSWHLNSVQYEDETGLIHYEWGWEIP